MKDKELFSRCLERWKFEPQLDMVVEECAELIKAINKWRRGKLTGVEVIREMVDVQLMIDQMRYFSEQDGNRFGVMTTSYKFWRKEKINRLKKMLKEGK